MASEDNADMLRRLRVAAVARGLCYTCRKRPVKPGTRYCEACLKRVKGYQSKRLYRFCRNCGARIPERRLAQVCARCQKKIAKRANATRLARIAAGLCTHCGKRPALPGGRYCLECVEDRRLRTIAHNRREGAEPRPCSVCGGINHSRKTHDRHVARLKREAQR